MEYLLLIANAPDAWDDPGPVPGDGVAADFDAYTRALEDAGVLRGGAGLHSADIATTVRVRDGERLLVDGPFMEAKEHIVGMLLIDVPLGACAGARRFSSRMRAVVRVEASDFGRGDIDVPATREALHAVDPTARAFYGVPAADARVGLTAP